MSVRSTLGASHEAHGRWKKVPTGEQLGLDRVEDLLLVLARVRSFSAGLHLFSRVRAEVSAWMPVRWWVPGRRYSEKPPFLAPPLMSEQIRPVVMSMPPIASMNLREVGQVDDDQVVDLDPGELLDRPDRQRRAAVGVGGVDLARAVTGDRRHRVARDREPPGGAAADPPQHDRVRADARVAGVGARLLGCPSAAGRSRGSAPCRCR